ncbi:MAG: glycosyltransferase family 2 protein [Bacilli bacterium]
MTSPKVSVIIPVYNCELYIGKCIQSVLNQGFSEFEIILVNDGSKDSSGKICENHAKQDPRIKVFHKKNGGASSARNLGLLKVRAEIVIFLDSDDWLAENAIEEIYKNMTLNSLDFLLFNPFIVKPDSINKVNDFNPNLYNQIVSNYTFWLNYKGSWAVWSSAFRYSLIEKYQIRFIEGITMEDLEFVPKYLYYSKRIMSIDSHLYFHNLCNSSAITQNNSVELKYLRTMSYLVIALSLSKHFEIQKLENDDIRRRLFVDEKLNVFFKSIIFFGIKDIDIVWLFKILKSKGLYPLLLPEGVSCKELLFVKLMNNEFLFRFFLHLIGFYKKTGSIFFKSQSNKIQIMNLKKVLLENNIL